MHDNLAILIAGNETLYLDLSERLPKTCRVFYCDTIGETLDRALDASIVIVDEHVAGGGDALCYRLRADPMTAGLPLLLCGKTLPVSAHADDSITTDIQDAVDTLKRFLPELPFMDPPARPEGGVYFDLDESTVSWRQSSPGDEWPPEAPELEPGKPILPYTRTMAGYVNSLVEALEQPASAPSADPARVRDMARLVLERMDPVLGAAQQAVNESLRQKDLAQMRELSVAKTALFERFQRLRSILRASGELGQSRAPLGAGVEAAGALGTTGPVRPAGALGTTRPLRPAGPSGNSEAGRLTGVAGPGGLQSTKSRLTIAAEQRDRKRGPADDLKNKRAFAPRTPPPPRSAKDDAKDDTPNPLPGVLLAMLGVFAILGFAYLLAKSEQAKPAARATNNAPPLMKFVTIQETPAGVMARPQADDPEGDRIVYAIAWYVNGTLIPNARTARLQPEYYRPGSAVYVEVVPSDSTGKGQPMRSQPLTIKGTRTPAGATPPGRQR